MECLIGAAHTRQADAAGLIGDPDPTMGRIDARYRDWRIGVPANRAKRWIDRNLAPGRMLTLLEATDPTTNRTEVLDGGCPQLAETVLAELRDELDRVLEDILPILAPDHRELVEREYRRWNDTQSRQLFEQLLRLCPVWSDRAIARQAGLDHKTVGALRRWLTRENPQPAVRLGRDGRLRRVRAQTGRKPTVEGAVPRQRTGEPPAAGPRDEPAAGEHRWENARRLRADPSIRATETGRMLLRALELHARMEEGWENIADDLAPHCLELVTELANRCADDWHRLIRRLRTR